VVFTVYKVYFKKLFSILFIKGLLFAGQTKYQAGNTFWIVLCFFLCFNEPAGKDARARYSCLDAHFFQVLSELHCIITIFNKG